MLLRRAGGTFRASRICPCHVMSDRRGTLPTAPLPPPTETHFKCRPSCCLVQHMGLQIVTELKVERNNRSFSRITSSPDVHCISSSSHKWPSHYGIAAAHNALNGYLPIVSDGQRTLDSGNFVSCHELMKRLNHSLDFTQGPPCSPLECASRPVGSKRENRLCWELAVSPIWHLPLVSYP